MNNLVRLYQAESLVEIAESKANTSFFADNRKSEMLRADLVKALNDLGVSIDPSVSPEELGAVSRSLTENLKKDLLQSKLKDIDLNKLLSQAAVLKAGNPELRVGQSLISVTPNEIVAFMPVGVSERVFHESDDTKATNLFCDTLSA